MDKLELISNISYIDQKVLHHEQQKEIQYLRDRIKKLESESFKQISSITENSAEKAISALVTQYNELQTEKLELETRFAIENTRFFELVEKLKDKLRLIALSTIEMESKIRILNAKVPELEQTCKNHNKTIDSLIFRFKNSSFNEIRNLESSLKTTEDTISHLEAEIGKMKKKNVELNTEIDTITTDGKTMRYRFETEKELLKETIAKLEKDNKQSEKCIDDIVNSDKQTFDKKAFTLKKEIDTLMYQMKKARKDKLNLMDENEVLKKEIKRLVLSKVITSRSSSFR